MPRHHHLLFLKLVFVPFHLLIQPLTGIRASRAAVSECECVGAFRREREREAAAEVRTEGRREQEDEEEE